VKRTEKEDLVAWMHKTFGGSTLLVVAHYTGLSVAEMTDLRGQMREAGASFKVTKNRLTRIALKGTKFESVAHLFHGPTAVAFSEDPVAAAKVVVDYGKRNEKLVVLGGALDDRPLDVDGIKALASLPSLDALRAKLLGMLNAPATRIAGVLQAPAGQLARVVGAHAAKGEAA
jgi:large subunit ribosomal protein L10